MRKASIVPTVGLLGAMLCSMQSVGQAQTVNVTVLATQMLNPTGVLASSNQLFVIVASGTVDLSAFNGHYRTNPSGTLVETPTGDAAVFFRDFAAPAGVTPVVGMSKGITGLTPGPLVGAPFGALVAGFTANPNPTSLADFASGFQFVGESGSIAAPDAGGYLFLAVNDWDVTYGDNVGGFSVQVSAVPEPSTWAMLGAGLLGLGAISVRRRKLTR